MGSVVFSRTFMLVDQAFAATVFRNQINAMPIASAGVWMENPFVTNRHLGTAMRDQRPSPCDFRPPAPTNPANPQNFPRAASNRLA